LGFAVAAVAVAAAVVAVVVETALHYELLAMGSVELCT
jgi:hypothetical protein